MLPCGESWGDRVELLPPSKECGRTEMPIQQKEAVCVAGFLLNLKNMHKGEAEEYNAHNRINCVVISRG